MSESEFERRMAIVQKLQDGSDIMPTEWEVVRMALEAAYLDEQCIEHELLGGDMLPRAIGMLRIIYEGHGKEHCGNCRFWRRIGGRCLAAPPRITGSHPSDCDWPQTEANMWCGAWEKKL